VVVDGGDTSTWMGMTRIIRKGGTYLDYGLYGCLAVGIPYANAAKLRNPEKRVLLITGDGSVGFNFMEFHTAIRKKLPIVVVIGNDQAWGMIMHISSCVWGTIFPRGRNWDGWITISWSKILAIRDLYRKTGRYPSCTGGRFCLGKTACVNVKVDPSVISPGSVALANLGGYKSS